MKRHIILLYTLFFTLTLFAQSWESVKNNCDYLCGEGRGNSIDEADAQALKDLVSKIAMNVEATSSSKDHSTVSNGQLDEESQFSASVNTYSSAVLTNTERVIIHNEPDAQVGRWIRRSEIQKIFTARIAKIHDFVSLAEAAEAKGKVDDALRYYYWSLTLLKSLQRPNDVTVTGADGRKHTLMAFIPQRMDDIFSGINAQVAKRTGDNVELYITYKGKPVNSIDYTYFDGRSWSGIYSAKDGRGVLELLPGSGSTTLQMKYEFEYRGQAQIDREVDAVLKSVRSTPMRHAYVTLGNAVAASAASVASNVVSATFSNTNATIKSAPKEVSDGETYMRIIDKVIRAIQAKDYTSVRMLFTDSGWDVYRRLLEYGRARIVGTPSCHFYRNGDYVMGRGVQMAFSFKSGVRKSFVEDVVFTFAADKRIDNVAFGLGNTAADDILNKGVWSESARMALMNFLENYKTAYGLKRLDYIRSVFDDDAVIIVGNVLRSATMNRNKETGVATFKNNEIIKRNRYTKDQYLDNLKRCFGSNEFINIRFANNDVIKMSKGGELYAIQIAQDYYSSSYGDKGYLFLMVDINNPDRPIIKVRTWQPDKDPNFGLYGPGDF